MEVPAQYDETTARSTGFDGRLEDFDDGLEQLFAATADDEEEIEKGLYVYEEGGEVAKQDAVDMVTRRPGEYGRT